MTFQPQDSIISGMQERSYNPSKKELSPDELGKKIYDYMINAKPDSVRCQAFSDLVTVEEARQIDEQMQFNAPKVKDFSPNTGVKPNIEDIREASSKSFRTRIGGEEYIAKRCKTDPEYNAEYLVCKSMVIPFLRDKQWLDDSPDNKKIKAELPYKNREASISYLNNIKKFINKRK